MSFSALRFSWTGVLSLALATPALAQGEEFIEVETLVNVLKGAAATDEQIKKAVEEANKILKQANVAIKHHQTKRDVHDQGNDDGVIDDAERIPLMNKGLEELGAAFGGGGAKGWKLYIVAGFNGASDVGAACHGLPFSAVRRLPTDSETGYSIAHEFSHNFCNGAGHTVEGDRKADDNGHIDDPTNLMDPELGGGTGLTRDQVDRIRRKAAKRGTVKRKAGADGVPQKQQQKRGEGPDPRPGGSPDPPGVPPKSDIQRSGMFAPNGQPRVEGQVFVWGRFDSTEVTNNTCWVYLDKDANPGTGQGRVVDDVQIGAEFIVRMDVTTDGVGPIHVSGELLDADLGQWAPLDSVARAKTETIYDAMPGLMSHTIWDFDALEFEIDAARIGALTTPSWMGVRMVDHITGTIDEMAFSLHDWPAPQADLTLDDYGVLPHAPVQAVGSGFTPFAAVHLSLDDSLVTTTYANFQGDFVVPFAAPAVTDTFFFVDAREGAGGLSDFSILHVLGDPVGIEEDVLPGLRFGILGANPVVGQATFELVLPKRHDVRLAIYNPAGRCLAQLLSKNLPAGRHQVAWSPRAGSTEEPSGMYFARLEVDDQVLMQRFVVLR